MPSFKAIAYLSLLQTLNVSLSEAAIAFDPTGQSDYDGESELLIPLNDSETGDDISIYLTAIGGSFNSNSGDFGIDSGSGTNDVIDGTDEAMIISFSKDIELISVDLGGVGTAAEAESQGARLTIAGTSYDLYTGQPDFDGTSDVFTPSSPIAISANGTIVLTGSSETSAFDLESIHFSVVPEPNSAGMLLALAAMGRVMVRNRR